MFNLDVTDLHNQHETNATGNFKSVMNTTINPRGGGCYIHTTQTPCWIYDSGRMV